MRSYAKPVILILPIILLSLISPIITRGEGTNTVFQSVSINIFFDISDNIGYVEENITFRQTSNETYIAIIPLIPPIKNNSRYAILNVRSGNNYLLYSIDQKENVLKVIVNNTASITINYMLFNYVEEVGIGLYTLFLDLSSYSNITDDFIVKISFLNTYDVKIYPKIGTKTSYSEKYITIYLSYPYTYTFVITEKSLEELGGYKSSISETGTTAITSSFGDYYYYIGLLVIAIAGLLLFILFRRRTMRVEVETIPATDLLSDETIRDIILIVGKYPEQGIKQSELVRKTGKPKSTISRRVNRLAKEEIIKIIRKGKYNIIKLTPKGKQLYEKLLEEKGNE